MLIAIIGKPSVGKSTLVNALLGKRKQPTGVTRTTLNTTQYDGIMSDDGHKFSIIDTAGMGDADDTLSEFDASAYSIITQADVVLWASDINNAFLTKSEQSTFDKCIGVLSEHSKLTGRGHQYGILLTKANVSNSSPSRIVKTKSDADDSELSGDEETTEIDQLRRIQTMFSKQCPVMMINAYNRISSHPNITEKLRLSVSISSSTVNSLFYINVFASARERVSFNAIVQCFEYQLGNINKQHDHTINVKQCKYCNVEYTVGNHNGVCIGHSRTTTKDLCKCGQYHIQGDTTLCEIQKDKCIHCNLFDRNNTMQCHARFLTGCPDSSDHWGRRCRHDLICWTQSTIPRHDFINTVKTKTTSMQAHVKYTIAKIVCEYCNLSEAETSLIGNNICYAHTITETPVRCKLCDKLHIGCKDTYCDVIKNQCKDCSKTYENYDTPQFCYNKRCIPSPSKFKCMEGVHTCGKIKSLCKPQHTSHSGDCLSSMPIHNFIVKITEICWNCRQPYVDGKQCFGKCVPVQKLAKNLLHKLHIKHGDIRQSFINDTSSPLYKGLIYNPDGWFHRLHCIDGGTGKCTYCDTIIRVIRSSHMEQCLTPYCGRSLASKPIQEELLKFQCNCPIIEHLGCEHCDNGNPLQLPSEDSICKRPRIADRFLLDVYTPYADQIEYIKQLLLDTNHPNYDQVTWDCMASTFTLDYKGLIDSIRNDNVINSRLFMMSRGIERERVLYAQPDPELNVVDSATKQYVKVYQNTYHELSKRFIANSKLIMNTEFIGEVLAHRCELYGDVETKLYLPGWTAYAMATKLLFAPM